VSKPFLSQHIYREDLALIHHRGFGDQARRQGREILALLRRSGIVTGTVLDLGCGDGTWLAMLTRAGFEAIGIDQSRALLQHARQAAPKARIRTGSIHRAALPQCDAVTAIGEVFNYRADNDPPDPLRRLFYRIHSALRPGGVLVFDMLVAGPRMHYSVWRNGRTWILCARVTEDASRRTLTRRIITLRQVGRLYRRSEETHVLRVPSSAEVLRQLGGAGFRARSSRRLGGVEMAPRRVVFVAHRPAGRTR
jgi:SAM-dependent methyltransferase